MTTTSNAMQSKIAGLILAGGRGTRMGGVDKALMPFDGHPIIAKIATQLAAQVAHIYIARQADQKDLGQWGEVIIDRALDTGPLGGLLVGIEAARKAGFSYLMTVPTDSPIFPSDLGDQLIYARAPHAMARVNGQAYPTFAIYDLSACKMAFEYFEAQKRSLRGWVHEAGCKYVDFPKKSILNFNQ